MSVILIFTFILLIVVCYAFWVWQAVRVAIRRSIEIEKTTVAYKQRPANPSLRILVAGDSTAVGVGTKPEESVAGRIGKNFPTAEITNIGINGLLLAGLRQKLIGLGEVHYDLVVLQIGANDILQRVPYEDVRKTLISVLKVAAMLGNRVVVMTAPNPVSSGAFRWPLSTYMSARTRAVRKIFVAEAVKHPNTVYVDLFEEKKEDPFYKDMRRYYSVDLFHPNGEGYGEFYKKVEPHLTEYGKVLK